MVKASARWHSSIKEIPEPFWKELAESKNIPFYQWNWLCDLEESGSISKQKGWQPLFLALWKKEKPIAVAPLYLKAHSYGEFVFDHPFAQLALDLGINYYPKLLGMSPFSPVEGYRFLIDKDEDDDEITGIMMHLIDDFAQKHGISSCNFLYVDKDWLPIAEAKGCAKWLNQQSLWNANNQKDFNDYLASFNSNQRRNIKRERKTIKESGLIIKALEDKDIDRNNLGLMHDFYESHCSRWGAWGSKYLSRKFFEALSDPIYKDQVVLFSAFRESPMEPIAMSLCITNNSKLWGRYWGSKENINSLHFELCYYSPIAWALENGIKSFDPGAGGSHKKRRGFIATPNISLHRWYSPKMDSIIRSWLTKVNELMLKEINKVNSELPFQFKTQTIQHEKS